MVEVIIPLITIVVLFVIILNMVQGRSQWPQAFEKIAERYGGWYSAARLTRPPAATFKYKETDCRVRCRRFGHNRSTRCTETRIAWPQIKPLKMEIVPAGTSPHLRALRNAQPLPTGDEHTSPATAGFFVFGNIRPIALI